MPRVIVSANGKGGVGKTTTVDILSTYLSFVKEEKTLLIDLDPSNCALSKKYVEMESDPVDLDGAQPPLHPLAQNNPKLGFHGRCSTADIFNDRPTLPYPTDIKNLDILPAYSGLLYRVESIGASEIKEQIDDKIADWLHKTDFLKNYKYILVDTPPVRSKTTKAILKKATDLIIPTSLEPTPIEGLFGMLQIWNQENLKRDTNNPLNLLGILPNMYRRNVKLQKGYLEFLEKNAGASQYLIPFQLDLSNTFSEIDHKRLNEKAGTIFDLPNRNKSKTQAIQFCEYIYKKIGSAP